MIKRISPTTTTFSIQLLEIEKNFNRLRSGSETLADILIISAAELDAMLHGEMEPALEQIDTLRSLGYNINL